MGRADKPRGRGEPVPRIALTGGIACGKTTVAKLFVALGARLIDTDQIARDVVEPGSEALQAILLRFGPQSLGDDGRLDRARLRDIVFRDPQARADLEAITHPRIRAEVALRSRTAGGPYQLIAIPLLSGTPAAGEYARVLVVDCEPEMQLRRLMIRDRIDAAAARRMIDAQASRPLRLSLADDVIRNDGDMPQLALQVEKLHKAYLGAPGYAK